MRVTGGQFGGRRLEMPKGPEIRPSLDNVKQAIFNIVGPKVQGARVLDLFGGTGALGIEALSRGASYVHFVDRSLFCVQGIQKNLETLGVDPAAYDIERAEGLTALRKLRRGEEIETFDLVLLDPPYGHDLARKALSALTQYAIVSPSGLVVAEHDKREHFPPQFDGDDAVLVLKRQERYGDTVLTFYERENA